MKTFPPEQRRNGFGSADAPRRDEFSNTLATRKYRETLNQESRLEKEQKKNDSGSASEADEAPAASSEAQRLYDIGRTRTTQFNQKSGRDTFYVYDPSNERRLGPYRLSSQDCGDSVDDAMDRPSFARVTETKQFLDASHLRGVMTTYD